MRAWNDSAKEEELEEGGKGKEAKQRGNIDSGRTSSSFSYVRVIIVICYTVDGQSDKIYTHSSVQ